MAKYLFLSLVVTLIVIFVGFFAIKSRSLPSIITPQYKSTQLEISPTSPINQVVVIATGDIMLGRTVNYKAVTENDFVWAFRDIANVTTQADITFSNLESPFNETCPLTNSGMIFCSDNRNIEGLIYAGVDIVDLANNHGGDQGTTGLTVTKENLTKHNLDYFGTHDQPLIYEKNNISIAFFGYNTVFPDTPELAWGERDRVMSDIDKVRSKVDYVIVSFHWGNEYTTNITDLQKDLAYASIDAGADMVIGHHPHWIQTLEMYNGKPILYSLGNFVFDQMWSENTRLGLAVKITLSKDHSNNLQMIPIQIHDFGKPVLIEEDHKQKILAEVNIPEFLEFY